jgi:hypothetical protein
MFNSFFPKSRTNLHGQGGSSCTFFISIPQPFIFILIPLRWHHLGFDLIVYFDCLDMGILQYQKKFLVFG